MPLVCKYNENIKISRGYLILSELWFWYSRWEGSRQCRRDLFEQKRLWKSNGSRGDSFLVNYREDKIWGGCVCGSHLLWLRTSIRCRNKLSAKLTGSKQQMKKKRRIHPVHERKKKGKRPTKWTVFVLRWLSGVLFIEYKNFLQQIGVGGVFSITELVVTPKISCKECNGMCWARNPRNGICGKKKNLPFIWRGGV